VSGLDAADAALVDRQGGLDHAIELEELTRDFGQIRAVDHLTLSVPRGEIYGFLGPNGAGKTTCLKMLTGLISPTAGTARVAGETVRPGELSIALRRKVGFLSEEPAFYGWMTAMEFLLFVGRVYGKGDGVIRAHAEELLATVDLADRRDARIKGFSRGMRQRLGIAQALMGDPDVLLLDEPASALDPIGRKEILDLIASLRGRATIIMSSHILDDVQRICTWVGIMRRGRLLVEAPLDRLLESYARPVFRVEVAEKTEELAAALRAEPWLREAVPEGGGLRVLAADPVQAQRRIPALVAGLGARLVEFVTVTPTLEDTFIHLVTEDTRGPTEQAASPAAVDSTAPPTPTEGGVAS
jgi:ABC-2 type transport system ATP-binding protein